MSYDDYLPFGDDEVNETVEQTIREIALANPHGVTSAAIIAAEQVCEKADNEGAASYSVKEKVQGLWGLIEIPATKTLGATESLIQRSRAAWGGDNAALKNAATQAATNKTVAETAETIAETGKKIAETENIEEQTKLLKSQRVGQDLLNFGLFTENAKKFMEMMNEFGYSADQKKQIFEQMIQQQGLTISTDNISTAVVAKEQEPDWVTKE